MHSSVAARLSWKRARCTELACFSRPKRCKHQQPHKSICFLVLVQISYMFKQTTRWLQIANALSRNNMMAFGFLWWDLETDQAHFIKDMEEMEEPKKVSQPGTKNWCSATQNWFLPTMTTQEVMLIRTKMNQNDKSSGPGCWRCSVFASRPGEFGSYQLHWGMWLVESEICKKMRFKLQVWRFLMAPIHFPCKQF